jgi:septal ring factor EnvC (AmiA/AmiB activator)
MGLFNFWKSDVDKHFSKKAEIVRKKEKQARTQLSERKKSIMQLKSSIKAAKRQEEKLKNAYDQLVEGSKEIADLEDTIKKLEEKNENCT